ncbi:MAG: hypothetical protein LBR16_03415 [Treponema sp.]|jgi:hypothetical protein|nr:hypothetical protein [Treponema sp.]
MRFFIRSAALAAAMVLFFAACDSARQNGKTANDPTQQGGGQDDDHSQQGGGQDDAQDGENVLLAEDCAALDLDPDESVTLRVGEAQAASSDSEAVRLSGSGQDLTVTGLRPGGCASITLTSKDGTNVIPVFVRSRKKSEVSERYGLYADRAVPPYDHQNVQNINIYKSIENIHFFIEAPDYLSSGELKTTCYDPHLVPHITAQYDAVLKKDVFAFSLHYSPDKDPWRENDGDMNSGGSDRQRLELKTMINASPANMYSTGGGDTFTYRWKFKLAENFAASPEFTHIHQIKPEGADSSSAVITLTPRLKGNGAVMQLIYSGAARPDGAASALSYLCEEPLSGFLGEWVYVEETISYGEPAAYAFKALRLRDLAPLMQYTYDSAAYTAEDPFVTYRPGNTYARAKFGFYRRIVSGGEPVRELSNPTETILYADIELEKHL